VTRARWENGRRAVVNGWALRVTEWDDRPIKHDWTATGALGGEVAFIRSALRVQSARAARLAAVAWARKQAFGGEGEKEPTR